MALASVCMPVSSACSITGSNALSCNCPASAAQDMVASMPMIMNTHWFTHSGMTGLTLPGMIDEPA